MVILIKSRKSSEAASSRRSSRLAMLPPIGMETSLATLADMIRASDEVGGFLDTGFLECTDTGFLEVLPNAFVDLADITLDINWSTAT